MANPRINNLQRRPVPPRNSPGTQIAPHHPAWASAAKQLDARDENRSVTIRPICIDDASHLIDSWVRSYRPSVIVGPIEAPVFHIEQRARINRLISRSRQYIACDKDEQTLIRGWICFEPPKAVDHQAVIHYVCVHPRYQLRGIGTALINIARQTQADPEQVMWATHETQPMRKVRPKWHLMYNPYLLEVQDALPAKVAVGHAHGSINLDFI